jgi:hypothetical protein
MASCLLPCEDCAAYEFRDGGAYTVPIGGKLLHPIGNPIMPSTHKGHGALANSIDKPTCFPIRIRRLMDGLEQLPLSRLSDASGVGNNPDALPAVRGTSLGKRYNVPLAIIPEAGQVPEKDTGPSPIIARKEVGGVFHEDVSGSYFANETGKLCPEAGSLSGDPNARSTGGNVLAREPAADNVNWSDICGMKRPHIVVARNVRPMFRQHAARERFDFAECHGFKAACALKAKAEAAD